MTNNSIITRAHIDTVDRAEYDRRKNEQYVAFERLCDLVEKALERFGGRTICRTSLMETLKFIAIMASTRRSVSLLTTSSSYCHLRFVLFSNS